ncbi:MAG TPA: phytoene desaturase family protein [Phycisphaerales bacterium]|nr:phytoene desaturase family protein [Phycisphaerales bacterium]HMP38617.1 phytoene desaturase family protein [Phycisphaerales bacterium]
MDAHPAPIAIVGAGPGGLAAAVLLAASGARVVVYEAQPEIGGRTGRLTKDGFAFDRGPTFFMMPYVLDEIFAAAGARLGERVTLRRLDPMYRLLIGRADGSITRIDAVQDLDRMAAQLDSVRPGDGDGFRRFMQDNRTKLRLMTPILRSPIRGIGDLIGREGLRAAPWVTPWRSLHDSLGRYFRDDAVRLAMSFQSKYLGMSPFECPSLFSILPFIEYEYGIWHPTGGCHALMTALAGVAVELGVEIRCGEPVTELRFEGRRVSALRAGGRWHEHRHVVLNADATWAMKALIPEALRGRETDAAIDSRRYSCSTFMMYLGLRGEVDLPHHTIYTSREYRRNLADIGEGRLSTDPSIYVCNPSRIDPTLAPPGCSSLYVLMPTANTTAPIDWDAERDRLRDLAYGQVERVLGAEGLRGRIISETTFTPADWRGMNINHGATFNLAHTLRQMLHRRPQHRLPGFEGLWLVGGGTHPGSGLPVIFLSAQITARLLCGELGLPCAADAARPSRSLVGAA